MKVQMSLGILITLSLIGGSVEAKAAGCEAIGNVRFICDQLAACRTEVFGRGAATARGHLMLP
jgi:hypothetical protein